MEKDKSLLDFLDKLYRSSIKADKDWMENRKDNRKFYKGDQWRRKQASYKAKSVTNFISTEIS